MPDDEGLKKLYQRATSRRANDGCPDGEQIQRLAAGEFPQAERLQLVDHLAECSDCSHEYRTALEVSRWADEVEGRATPAAARLHWRWVAVAATIVLAIGFPVWIGIDDDGEPDPAFRTVDRAVDTAVTPSDGARLEGAPSQLVWAPHNGAAYHVELYDEESSLIWRSERIETAAVELPQAVRDRIDSGDVYYWRVFNEFEAERTQSELYLFEIGR